MARVAPIVGGAQAALYDRSDYPYPQSVELDLIAAMGGRVYSPYTGRSFADRRQTDIEHMIATSEAHDSGLCAAEATTRRAFARDLLNLTLAAPEVNRCGRGGKCGLDAAEWLPQVNRCWFAGRIVQVRRKYGMTIDRREAETLSGCTSTERVVHVAASGTAPAAPAPGDLVRSGEGSGGWGAISRPAWAMANPLYNYTSAKLELWGNLKRETGDGRP